MTPILSIETSTRVCSAAIHTDGVLTGQVSVYLDKSHASRLAVMVDQLLEDCEVERGALGAVAVSGGPGSYTGLRIGCSLAKGMCFALGIPLISVSTLKAMARQVAPFVPVQAALAPMLDARRMEVYTMVMDRQGEVLEEVHPLVLENDSYQQFLDGREVFFFGNGSDKARDILRHPNARFIAGITAEARTVGLLAAEKFSRHEFENVAYYEPFYLKEFQATKPKKRL